MNKLNYDILKEYISNERLLKYFEIAEKCPEKAFELYFNNLATSKEIYEILHWLEIVLRNAIAKQLSIKYGNEWFDNPKLVFSEKEQKSIERAKEQVIKERKELNHSNIVATITLGFWVHIFGGHYENLWRTNLRQAFKNCSHSITRKDIQKRLFPILKLRNRIAHYEPILQYPLDSYLQNVLTIIGWTSPEILELLENSNQIKDVMNV